MKNMGSVTLIGAGPGDPELLTLKAIRKLKSADVIVYDRLVSVEILALVPQTTKMIAVGKAPKNHPVPQEKINQILIEAAQTTKNIVRLKGGDPFLFGRGSEESLALAEYGIKVEIVPGITAAQGVACATGVPLTHRGIANGVRYVTGHLEKDRSLQLDWSGLANDKTTLVIYMGGASIAEIANKLIAHGMPNNMPVLAVSNATTPLEQRLLSYLGSIETDFKNASLKTPVLFIIGKVVSLYENNNTAFNKVLSQPDGLGVAPCAVS